MKFLINKWILPLIAGLFHKKGHIVLKNMAIICKLVPKYYSTCIVFHKNKCFIPMLKFELPPCTPLLL